MGVAFLTLPLIFWEVLMDSLSRWIVSIGLEKLLTHFSFFLRLDKMPDPMPPAQAW